MSEEKLTKILDYFGPAPQRFKLYEEMSELTVAIERFVNNKGSKDSIAEELADVMIMIEQMRILFDISPILLTEIAKFKIDRTMNKIDYKEEID